jgi:hypothetical protein
MPRGRGRLRGQTGLGPWDSPAASSHPCGRGGYGRARSRTVGVAPCAPLRATVRPERPGSGREPRRCHRPATGGGPARRARLVPDGYSSITASTRTTDPAGASGSRVPATWRPSTVRLRTRPRVPACLVIVIS